MHQSHLDIGYPSELVEGEAACMKYMKNILFDWQARGITILMHKKKAGYANNGRSMEGLAVRNRQAAPDVRQSIPMGLSGRPNDGCLYHQPHCPDRDHAR